MDVSKTNLESLISLENEINEYKIDQKTGISLDKFIDEGVEIEVDEDAAMKEEEFDLYSDSKELVDYLNPPCLAQLHTHVFDCFDELKESMVSIHPHNLLHKKVIQEGKGAEVNKSSHVTIHYNAYLESQDVPFDSSRLRSLPQKFVMGKGQVLPGLELGVETMRVGEISIFVVDSQLAYREMGAPPRIPPYSLILFEVELLNALDNATDALEYDRMDSEERSKQPFSKVYQVCLFEKNMGNDLIKRNAYSQALTHYQRAIHYLEGLGLLTEKEETAQRDDLLFKLFLNASFCRLKLQDASKAIWFARKALRINSHSTKAMFRYAKGLMMKHCLGDAKKILFKASALEPRNQEIIQAIAEINQIEQKNLQQEKQYCKRMFESKKSANDSQPSDLPPMEDKAIKKLREILERFVRLKLMKMAPIGTTYTPMELETIRRVAKEYDISLMEPIKEHGPYRLVKNNF